MINHTFIIDEAETSAARTRRNTLFLLFVGHLYDKDLQKTWGLCRIKRRIFSCSKHPDGAADKERVVLATVAKGQGYGYKQG
jgi:hypothetical protein